MSWQVIETGFVRDVQRKISADLATLSLPEPEHSVMSSITIAVDAALQEYPDHYGVFVKIRGAQMPGYNFETAQPQGVLNALSLEISPLPGYGIKPKK